MFKLDGLVAFLAVAEAGSISGAAQRLAKPKSVISERLAELERELGTRLVQRTTRKLSLTEDGRVFRVRAERILAEITEGTAELAERRGTLSGPLRLAAPVGFGILHLSKALGKFLGENPDIDLVVDLNDRFVDAAADGFDAVLRHGPIGDTRLVAKRLAASRRLLVAAPAYLAAHGTPGRFDDLARHRGILYANRGSDWRFSTPEGWVVARPRAALRVNNGIMMRDAAVAGLGLALLPTFFVHDGLAAGTLVEVDIGLAAESAELFIAYPRDRSASAKVLALVESLRASFGDPPYWNLSATGVATR